MKYPTTWKDYELLDFGNARKLERFGNLISNRPQPSATNKPYLSKEDWDKAALSFQGRKKSKGKLG